MVGYTHFMDESVEAQRVKVTYLRSWIWEGEEPYSKSRSQAESVFGCPALLLSIVPSTPEMS